MPVASSLAKLRPQQSGCGREGFSLVEKVATLGQPGREQVGGTRERRRGILDRTAHDGLEERSGLDTKRCCTAATRLHDFRAICGTGFASSASRR
jgi:hypothetical protein